MKGAVVIGAAVTTGTAAAAVAMPWPEIFKGILGAGGVPPALFLLMVLGLVSGLIWALNALKNEQAARDVERAEAARAAKEIQEKRIEQGLEMMKALERTAAALTTHTVAVESRTVMMNALVKGVDKFATQEEASRKYFEAVSVRLETGITDILKILSKAG